MATLISNASGNLTGAATFAAAEVGALSLVLNRSTLQFSSAAGSFTSPTFTVTNGKVIDAVLLWVKQFATGSTGTLKIDLQKGGVSQASVTVNKTDLPDSTIPNANTPPVLFKLTTTATGDGGSNWTIVFTTTGTQGVNYYTASGVAANLTRALRTTTAATPAAADDLYIVGELTGAGTHNSYTVTMDSIAATAYGNGALNSGSVAGGGIHISCYGTLNYGTTGATNYVLRVNGDVMVYQFGTLNMGSTQGGSSVTTWNPSDKSAHFVLSGGNLVAGTTFSGDGAVRSTTSKTSGKVYFEVTWATGSFGGDTGCGIATSSASLSLGATSTGGLIVYGSSGSIWFNGTGVGISLGASSASTVVCFAIDLVNSQAWARLNGGNWNNSGTANPATNTGGVNIAALFPASAAFAIVCANQVLDPLATVNFGATTFAQTTPSGFTAWNVTSASTAVLEFQQLSADGDFGLRLLDNSVTTITGQPRTSGKNVVKCKLTADVASANVMTSSFSASNGTVNTGFPEASNNSLLANNYVDSAANANHQIYGGGVSVTNTTQTGSIWLARGSGTTNRFVRVAVGNNFPFASVTNGFYSDIDLQAGTAGTVTVIGNGTATSVSITPAGTGFVVRITGKCSSGAATAYFQVLACSAAGTTVYTGNTTQCFLFDHGALVTAASISDTTFNVDTDTGWLNGDAVCVASTTRTAAECEIYPLSVNAGTSSFTSALYPFGTWVVPLSSTHHGTAPVQAEIGLLTRNVKIRSTSNTLMSYVYCTALATVTASWAEFYYIGTNAVGKRGIEIDGGAVTNPKSFTYCSLHDLDNNGLYCNALSVTSLNVTFSNNVIWMSYAAAGVQINGAVTNTDWIFDSNLLMRTSTYGIFLADLGGICSNNTVAGGVQGFYLSAPQDTLGTFDGNTAHSGSNVGLSQVVTGILGTISNFTAWRNINSGVIYSNITNDLVFTNLTLFGNSTAPGQGNFSISFGDTVTIRGGLIAGDTSFAVPVGFSIQISTMVQFNLTNVDMSGTGSIYAPHTTNDIYSVQTPTNWRGVFNNCKFGATNALSAKTPYWSKSGYLSFEKYNQTAGDHRTEMTFGQLRTDATVFKTAAPSMKMTPNSASNKLESAPLSRGMLVAVNSGSTVTTAVYVRKDTTYTGNQPRLIVRANPAIGISSDTVLATYSTGTGTWNQLSGTTITATDAGAMEFVIDCDGTAGFINIDDWTASTS